MLKLCSTIENSSGPSTHQTSATDGAVNPQPDLWAPKDSMPNVHGEVTHRETRRMRSDSGRSSPCSQSGRRMRQHTLLLPPLLPLLLPLFLPPLSYRILYSNTNFNTKFVQIVLLKHNIQFVSIFCTKSHFRYSTIAVGTKRRKITRFWSLADRFAVSENSDKTSSAVEPQI